MKKTATLFFVLLACVRLSAQFIAKMEVKEPIPGTCDTYNIYAIFPGFTGQTAPVCPMTNADIQKKLDTEIPFLQTHKKFKAKLVMVNCIINCKGELVRCEIDRKSGDDELDKQIVAVFSLLKQWKSGTVSGKDVDCVELFSMHIKKGKITLDS